MIRSAPGYVWGGLGLVAAVYVASFVRPPMPPIHGDGLYTYYWARSLAFDGDFDLTNDYQICGDPWRKLSADAPVSAENTWSPGPALLWTPFLLVARWTDPSLDQAAKPGCHLSTEAEFAMWGTVLAGLLTVWLIYRFSARHVGPVPACLGAVAVAVATNLPYYATLLPSYGHGPAAFAVALALERWDATRGSRRLSRWVWIGLLVGFAMLMRAQCALIAVAPLFEWLGLAHRDWREHRLARGARLVLAGALFCVGAVAAFFPQMYAWHVTYGRWFTVPQGPHYMRWMEPSLDGVLFATTGGLLFWTPILYLAFAGLVRGALRVTPRVVPVALLLLVFAFVVVNASVWDYWGSAGFSNRRFVELALPFGYGLAVSFAMLLSLANRHPARFATAVLVGLIAVAAAWNYGAMWGIAEGKIRSHREDRSDRIGQNIFAQVTENTWEAVGNPVVWPAALPFALRHGTHPKRYDVMRGQSIFYERFEDLSLRPRENVVRFSGGYHWLFAARGFERRPRRVDGRKSVVTNAAEAMFLIPLFADDVGRIRVSWTSRPERRDRGVWVQLRWNGRTVASHLVTPGWSNAALDIPAGTAQVGVNRLEWSVHEGRVAFDEIEFLKPESQVGDR